MKTILVTGGLGFIGSNFIRMLLSDDPSLRIINLDKQTYAGNPENLADLESDDRYRVVIGAIGDEGLVSRILDEHEPDAIVNFAAESHVEGLRARLAKSLGTKAVEELYQVMNRLRLSTLFVVCVRELRDYFSNTASPSRKS